MRGCGWWRRRCRAMPAHRRRTTTASRTTRGITAELAREVGADVVVGFSMGGSVALEMVASGEFQRAGGPARYQPVGQGRASVLPRDRRARQRARRPPAAVLAGGSLDGQADPGVRGAPERVARRTSAGTCRRQVNQGLREYVRWLHRYERPAERLCGAASQRGSCTPRRATAGSPTRSAAPSRRAPHAHVVTVPGQVCFLPNEVPERDRGRDRRALSVKSAPDAVAPTVQDAISAAEARRSRRGTDGRQPR